MKNNIPSNLIKGFVIGSSMLVPGVSGGTMAIILGIYDELIHAVSSFGKNLKENSFFLGQFVLAGLVGILTLAGPMLKAITLWREPMMFFFMGAIIGSIPPLYRKVRVSRIRPINMGVAAFGAFLGTASSFLPKEVFTVSHSFSPSNFMLMIGAGIIIAIALVLPGISASYVLLMMGIYDLTLQALREMNFFFLVPLIIGVLGGTFLTAGILEREMKRHPQFTYMLIIGFMIGSLLEIFPGLPAGSLGGISCLATFAAGLTIILVIGRKGY